MQLLFTLQVNKYDKHFHKILHWRKSHAPETLENKMILYIFQKSNYTLIINVFYSNELYFNNEEEHNPCSFL